MSEGVPPAHSAGYHPILLPTGAAYSPSLRSLSLLNVPFEAMHRLLVPALAGGAGLRHLTLCLRCEPALLEAAWPTLQAR